MSSWLLLVCCVWHSFAASNYLYYLLFISHFNYYVVAITSWWIKDYHCSQKSATKKTMRFLLNFQQCCSLQSIGGPWTLKSERELQAFPVTRQSVLRGGVHDQIWRRDWRLAIEQRNESFQDSSVHKRISVRYACGLHDEPTYRSQRALVVRYVTSDVMSVHVRASIHCLFTCHTLSVIENITLMF